MHTCSLDKTVFKKLLLDDPYLPPDDREHQQFLVPLQLQQTAEPNVGLDGLIRFMMAGMKGRRTAEQEENLRRHLVYVLLNLARALLGRHWLLVSMTKNDYAAGGDFWLNYYKLSYTYMKKVIASLLKLDLITLLPGKKYKSNPSRTRIYPTERLQNSLWPHCPDTEEEIKPPYVTINEPSEGYKEVVDNLSPDHPDLQALTEINDFLKSHSWACKGPVVMKFKHTPFQSGRLITAFQQLPDRRRRIRINTFIDGLPICEVDFSANHLRLNLAVLSDVDAGDSPYEDIIEACTVKVDRDKVKKFITVAMGSSAENKAWGACKVDGFTHEEFKTIKTATLQRFPDLKLFIAFGIVAQSLEGQILKEVMLAGARAGIVCLPVHDAVAVQQVHADWAKEAMLSAWTKIASPAGSSVRARVKVDYP